MMGVGVAALVANYWWVFLLLALLPAVVKVLDKPHQSSNSNPKPRDLSSSNAYNQEISPPPFAGEADLQNDSYIIYLTKKYCIEKSDVLGQYICKDKLFPTLDDVLRFANESEIRVNTMSREEVKAEELDLEAKECGIAFDGERYRFQTYSYDRLEDAIRYAKLQRK